MSNVLPTPVLEDDRVIDLQTAAEVCGLSLATFRRRIDEGHGPRLTRTSARRIGVRAHHLREWLDRLEVAV